MTPHRENTTGQTQTLFYGWYFSCCLLMCKRCKGVNAVILQQSLLTHCVLTGVAEFLHIYCKNGPLPVVVLWRLDFIQAPGSGIISMQMFFTVNRQSNLGGVRGWKSGGAMSGFHKWKAYWNILLQRQWRCFVYSLIKIKSARLEHGCSRTIILVETFTALNKSSHIYQIL